MISAHHQQAVDELVERARSASFQAVILSGSIAKGTAKASSDIDAYLVVAEDDYAERKQRHHLAFFAPCSYEGGYIDGKIISVGVLEAAADRGSEPMRSSFVGSTVVHSTIGDLQPLVDRIPVYPEANRSGNMHDFYTHFAIHSTYFGRQAIERDDPFLLNHSLSLATLYASRMVLAYNRVLYPCPKQLLSAVAACTEKPESFIERTRGLLRQPTAATLQDYVDLVTNFADWGNTSPVELVSRFMELDEWSWLDGDPALAQR